MRRGSAGTKQRIRDEDDARHHGGHNTDVLQDSDHKRPGIACRSWNQPLDNQRVNLGCYLAFKTVVG